MLNSASVTYADPFRDTTRSIAQAAALSLVGMAGWVMSMAWLNGAWRRLVAVAKVEHISVGGTPEAVNGAVAQFPWFVALVLGTMGVLLIRRWILERSSRELLARSESDPLSSEEIKESLRARVAVRVMETRRLTRAFLWACAVGSVGNAILVAFILWAVRGYFS